jgi:hypothetical protein
MGCSSVMNSVPAGKDSHLKGDRFPKPEILVFGIGFLMILQKKTVGPLTPHEVHAGNSPSNSIF